MKSENIGEIMLGNRGNIPRIFIVLTLLYLGLNAQALWANSGEFKNFTLKNPQLLQKAYNAKSGISPVDFQEDNPLYQEILNELNNQYEQIGERQAQDVLAQRDGLYLGGLNNVGFRWGSEFGEFRIDLRRDLSPDITDDSRWIVRDQFTIIIEASKVLSNLDDMDVIDISEEQLAAFAGLKFRRKYTYTHFADSYGEGLRLELDKLFMAFKPFRGKGFLDLEDYEFIQKEDALSFNVGGLASTPIYQTGGLNVSATAGLMYKYHRLAKVDVQAVGDQDRQQDGEELRISVEKTKGQTFGGSASIQADFLKILRLTLLSYDFSYSYEETFRSYLSFYESDLERLEDNTPLSREVGELLRLKSPNDRVLAPYIVSQERREKEMMNSKYTLFLLSGETNQETEFIEIVKDGQKKTFFRHNYRQEHSKQGFLSRLVSAFLKSFLQLGSQTKNQVKSTKNFKMEYESQRNLVKKKRDLDIRKDDVLSLEFRTDFYASGKKGRIRDRHKDKAKNILEKYSGVDPLIVDQLSRDKFRAPMKIKSQYEMGKKAIKHFNRLSPDDKYEIIDDMCGAADGFWGFFRNLFNGCLNSVKRSYEKYEYELHHSAYGKKAYKRCLRYSRSRFGRRGSFRSRRRNRNIGQKLAVIRRCLGISTRKSHAKSSRELPLWRLKDFMQTMYKESDNKVDMYEFFGLENIFLYGEFQAKTSEGIPFTSHFTEGKFRTMGVIEDYRQKEGLSRRGRSPASKNYSEKTLAK